jgi:hypothetical protein
MVERGQHVACDVWERTGAKIVLWQRCDEIGQHFKAKLYSIKFKV